MLQFVLQLSSRSRVFTFQVVRVLPSPSTATETTGLQRNRVKRSEWGDDTNTVTFEAVSSYCQRISLWQKKPNFYNPPPALLCLIQYQKSKLNFIPQNLELCEFPQQKSFLFSQAERFPFYSLWFFTIQTEQRHDAKISPRLREYFPAEEQQWEVTASGKSSCTGIALLDKCRVFCSLNRSC